MNIGQILEDVGEIHSGVAIGYCDVPPALAIAVRNQGSRQRWAKLREHLTGIQPKGNPRRSGARRDRTELTEARQIATDGTRAIDLRHSY